MAVNLPGPPQDWGRLPWDAPGCFWKSTKCRKYAAMSLLFDNAYDKKNTIIGLQNVNPEDVTTFKKLTFFMKWGVAGYEKDDPEGMPGHTPILYRPKYVDLLDVDRYPPKENGPFLMALPKISHSFTIAAFRDKRSGNVFIVANTHLDQNDDERRQKQLALFLEQIQNMQTKHENANVILTGTFDSEITGKAYGTLKQSGWKDLRHASRYPQNNMIHGYTLTDFLGEDQDRTDQIWLQHRDPGFDKAFTFYTKSNKWKSVIVSNHKLVRAVVTWKPFDDDFSTYDRLEGMNSRN